MAFILDEIIEQKLEEMRDAEMASTKDIVDILAFAWKIRTDTVKEVREAPQPTNQTNVQNNLVVGAGDNYNQLLGKLLKPDT